MLDCACSPPGLGLFLKKKKKKAPPPNAPAAQPPPPPAEIAPKEVAPPPQPPVVVKPSILKIQSAGKKINFPSVALYSAVGIGAIALLWFLSRKKK
jgi:hypothetical protein